MTKKKTIRKPKYADLIEKIKKENPKDQWNVKIKAAIAEEVKNNPVNTSSADPMGISNLVHSISREKASEIAKSGMVISQFVRPGKRELSEVIIHPVAGRVYRKFRRNPPIGVLVALVFGDKLLIGWSKYNKNKEILAFSKKTAVETAVMRAFVDRIYPYGPSDYKTAEGQYIPRLITKDITNFLKRVEGAFTRKASNVGVFVGTA